MVVHARNQNLSMGKLLSNHAKKMGTVNPYRPLFRLLRHDPRIMIMCPLHWARLQLLRQIMTGKRFEPRLVSSGVT